MTDISIDQEDGLLFYFSEGIAIYQPQEKQASDPVSLCDRLIGPHSDRDDENFVEGPGFYRPSELPTERKISAFG
ncbi:MAG: hypothetical protein METHAR1v1_1660009, partial [Methanothrix sp.]